MGEVDKLSSEINAQKQKSEDLRNELTSLAQEIENKKSLVVELSDQIKADENAN